jgi:putative oxidoreductase
MRYLPLPGRLLFSFIFILSATTHFSSATIGYAANQGVPMANLLVPLSGVLALAGGLSVLIGYKARVGALLLIMFLVPVTLMMHRFWGLSDPQAVMMQRINFMKNLSILGGAMMIAYFGAGPVSVDEWLRTRAGRPERARPSTLTPTEAT